MDSYKGGNEKVRYAKKGRHVLHPVKTLY